MIIVNNISPVVNLLVDNIPPRPYSCDTLGSGLYRHQKSYAMRQKYIQVNGSNRLGVIILDVDYNVGVVEQDNPHLPPPNIISVNPQNGHAHIFYILECPVVNKAEEGKKVRFFEDVRDGLTGLWHADPAYVGLISKNPFSPAWFSRIVRMQPYTLADLRGWIPEEPRKMGRPLTGTGRNCDIFNTVRIWAYSAIQDIPIHADWFDMVLRRCQKVNNELVNPLGIREVISIAKSISSWTWEHFHTSKEAKTMWGKKAREKSMVTQQKNKETRMKAFKRLYVPDETSILEVCQLLNISKSTGLRYAREIREKAQAEAEQPELDGLNG